MNAADRQGTSRYPWKSWMDGKQHRIVQGVDFSTSPNTMRQQLHQYASRNGMKVKTRLFDNTLIFKFVKPEPEKTPELASYGSGRGTRIELPSTAGEGLSKVYGSLLDELQAIILDTLAAVPGSNYGQLHQAVEDSIGAVEPELFRLAMFALMLDDKLKISSAK